MISKIGIIHRTMRVPHPEETGTSLLLQIEIQGAAMTLMIVMISKIGIIQAEFPNPNIRDLMIAIKMIKKDVNSLMTVMITKDEIIQAEVPNPNDQDLMIVIQNNSNIDVIMGMLSLKTVMPINKIIIQTEIPNPKVQDLDVIMPLIAMITKDVPNPNDLDQMIVIKSKDVMHHLMRVMITKDKIIQVEVPNRNNQDLMI